MNIWVVALPKENAGYAQMPGRGTMETDGVVINYHYFGMTTDENFGQGASLSFLIAQYLNLYPLSGHSLDYPCSDDYVDDTPLHNSRNSGCPSSLHISICTKKYAPEMLMNIMSSNTSDNWKYMFTRGQAARMQAVLDTTGFRSDLALSESICKESDLVELDSRNTKLNANSFGANTKLNIYPNPTQGLLNISFETAHEIDFDITIMNTIGKTVMTNSFENINGSFSEQFVFTNLPSGIYFVEISNNDAKAVYKITLSK